MARPAQCGVQIGQSQREHRVGRGAAIVADQEDFAAHKSLGVSQAACSGKAVWSDPDAVKSKAWKKPMRGYGSRSGVCCASATRILLGFSPAIR